MQPAAVVHACLMLLTAATLSCTRPPSDERFVSREKAEYGDTYPFTLDFSDTTYACDLSFFTRLERAPFEAFPRDTLVLCLRWIAPSATVTQDTTFLDLGAYVDSSYFARDYLTLFQRGFIPAEQGVWRLKVKVLSQPEHLSGLGVICHRNKRIWATEN